MFDDHPALHGIPDDDEALIAVAQAGDSALVVTDRRLAVITEATMVLVVDLDRIQRMEFTFDKGRPGLLVIAPEGTEEVQALNVEPDGLATISTLLELIGHRLVAPSG